MLLECECSQTLEIVTDEYGSERIGRYLNLVPRVLELAEDATLLTAPEDSKPVLDEICIISVPSMVITVEAGVGTKTLPMLLLESNLQAHVRNWSSSVSTALIFRMRTIRKIIKVLEVK